MTTRIDRLRSTLRPTILAIIFLLIPTMSFVACSGDGTATGPVGNDGDRGEFDGSTGIAIQADDVVVQIQPGIMAGRWNLEAEIVPRATVVPEQGTISSPVVKIVLTELAKGAVESPDAAKIGLVPLMVVDLPLDESLQWQPSMVPTFRIPWNSQLHSTIGFFRGTVHRGKRCRSHDDHGHW